MKLLVRTTGDFQLISEDTGDLIRSHEASVVRPSKWLEEQVAAKRIEILEEVGDKASNAEWDDTLKQSDGDFDLAQKSFASEFPSKKDEDENAVQPLPVTNTSASKANQSGQTAGLADDVKPGAPGSENGPGGPKDTNVPKAAAKPHTPAAAAKK